LSDTTVKDRRAHRRHEAELDVQGQAAGQGLVVRMVTRNLSAGGVYCTSSHDFREMTRLAVRLMLPPSEEAEPEPVDVEAVVVRRRELAAASGAARYEYALFFHKVAPGARERIERFLSFQE
jgi:hypothetical protein